MHLKQHYFTCRCGCGYVLFLNLYTWAINRNIVDVWLQLRPTHSDSWIWYIPCYVMPSNDVSRCKQTYQKAAGKALAAVVPSTLNHYYYALTTCLPRLSRASKNNDSCDIAFIYLGEKYLRVAIQILPIAMDVNT